MTEAGEFNLPSLPVGVYRVTIESEGFKTFATDDLRVEAGGAARINARLEVGGIRQTVEVSAVATQLQADDAKLQNTFSDQLIESLPTVVSDNMRSPFDLANLTAGVSGGDQDFRIGGGQQGSFGVLLDGSSANTNRAGSTLWASVNSPSLEAITAGGGLISFVSKSGTNKYHGSLFDFIRNNAFDARGFYNRTTPVYRQHDFGATVGGPIRIPKLYNRIGGVTSAIALPPAEFYDGDFRNAVSRTRSGASYIRYQVFDPATTRGRARITQEGWFPLQPRDRPGNMTRNNPKMRNFPIRNEDVSLAKTFALPGPGDSRREVALRFEGFNLLNRTQFGTPNLNLNDAANLGLVRTQSNSARRLQFAAKVNW